MAYLGDEFLTLKQAGLDEIHAQVQDAMSYYHNNPSECCLRFRYALESVLLTVYELADEDPPLTNQERICNLEKLISKDYLPKGLLQDMQTLRKVTNRYHHYPLDLYNPEKDRLTCKHSMESISEWVVAFSGNPETWKKSTASYASVIKKMGTGLVSALELPISSLLVGGIRELFKKRLLKQEDNDE